jgi:hypothetical protein
LVCWFSSAVARLVGLGGKLLDIFRVGWLQHSRRLRNVTGFDSQPIAPQGIEAQKAGLASPLLVRHAETGRLMVNLDRDVMTLIRWEGLELVADGRRLGAFAAGAGA